MKKGLHFRIFVFILFNICSYNLQAQFWQIQSGPGGGGYQICHTDSNIFLLDYYNIYKSNDEGLNWQRVTTASIYGSTDILAKGTTILRTENFEIYRSVDEGLTWTLSTPPFFNCSSLSKDEQYIYAASTQKIFRSSDDGVSWSELQISNVVFDLLSVNHNRMLISDNSFNILKVSTDTGATFTSIGGAGLWNGITELFCANTSMLIGAENGLFISMNQGTNWTRVIDIPDSSEIHSVIKNDSTLYLASSTGAYKSTNDGVNWSQLSVENTDLIDVHNGVLIADVGYIKRSANNGVTWEYSAAGISNGNITSLFTDGNDVFSGNFYSPDNGINWEPREIGSGQSTFNHYSKFGSYIYAGIQQEGFFRTIDRGLNWINIFNGSQIRIPTDILIFDSLIFVSNYHIGNRIFVSSDSGLTWTAASNGLALQPVLNLQKKDSEIYCATTNEVYKSIDIGQNWVSMNCPNSSPLSLVLVHEDLIIACGHNSIEPIHFTINGGLLWNQMPTSWSDTSTIVSDAIIYNNTLIVATREPDGIFMTSDTGQTWVELTSNFCDFHPDHATKLAISGNKLLAGSSLNGIWETDLTFLSANDNLPENEIVEVYPNPVNEKFSVFINARESQVKELKLFDLLGNTLKTVEAPILQNHQLEVDVNNYSPGIYIVKVQFGNSSYTSKFIKL